ncbi:MAG: STN domain-containing protein [Bacteroidota bacterium]
MARSLFLKEKVAALTSLLILLAFTTHAQSSSSQNITYTCRATQLETVLNSLSKQSGYDFIYSKSIVDVTKPVSLNVKNKSINEVLSLIERQANISFKLHDRHIVIKSNPKPAPVIQRPDEKAIASIKPMPALESNDSLLLTSNSRTIPVRAFDSQARQLESNLNRRILELQQLLGVNVPHNIPKYYVNRINFDNRHKGWFAAIGTYVSDNASGVEFQGGLSYVYGVFTPRWAIDHGFYGAYGIGNTLQLSGHFSINSMYVYSGYTATQVLHKVVRQNEVRHQHQVKFALRYSFSENLSLRAGPVFNYQVKTINKAPLNPSPLDYRRDPTLRFTNQWIGWELSLQYRINFYKREY